MRVTALPSRPRGLAAPPAARGPRGPRRAGLARLTEAVDARRPVLRGSIWLLASLATTALSGLVFWLISARLFPEASIGRAAALFASVLFVTYATSLGLPVAVARHAHDDSLASHVLLRWTLVATTASSAIGTIAFVALVPSSVVEPLWAWGQLAGVTLFFLVVTGMSLAAIVDVRLMTMRRWSWVLARVALVGVARLALLAVDPVGDDAVWTFLLAAGVPALSGLLGAAALLGAHGGAALGPLPSNARTAARYAGVNYLAMLASQAPQFVVPLVVALHVSPATNASFYVAWSITAVVFLVPQTIGQVLLVEGARTGSGWPDQVALGFVVALGLAGVAALAATAFSWVVPAVYGAGYDGAARILPGLVAASLAWAVTSVCLADARVRDRTTPTVVMTLTFALATTLPAAVLTGRDGLDGTVRAWMGGNAVAAVVAATVYLRDRRARPLAAPDGAG